MYKLARHKRVAYEWGPVKAQRNLQKRGVDFADAMGFFEGEYAFTMRDPFSPREERWIRIGSDWLGRVLVVVHTWRGNNVRIISARSATPRERKQYEERG
jgi:uncharacterized DUF497 family protein